jgi:hypothetical protein
LGPEAAELEEEFEDEDPDEPELAAAPEELAWIGPTGFGRAGPGLGAPLALEEELEPEGGKGLTPEPEPEPEALCQEQFTCKPSGRTIRKGRICPETYTQAQAVIFPSFQGPEKW